MDDLHIRGTDYSLAVTCDAGGGVIELSGSSYPENAFEFFRPIAGWVESYLAAREGAVVLIFRLNYLNTSSSKCVLDLLYQLEQFRKHGGTVAVNWYYEKDDEDILEAGTEFAEDIDLPFNYIPS